MKIRIKPILLFENLANLENKKNMRVVKADPWVIVRDIMLYTDKQTKKWL